MNENLEVNYDKLEELLEEQIAGGTDAIVICGTTGESATLTEEEHMRTIKFAIDKVNHRIPVVAGTGSNSTATATQMSKEAAEAGADGILLVTPYYNKGTQNGLIRHYTTITDEAKVPAILYNVPSRTGCSLATSTVAYLAKNAEYVTAIKEASGDISHVADIMYACDGAIDLYSGNDDQIVPILSLGGKGVISVLSNVAPKETHDIVALFLEGKIKESRELQLKALPLVHALFSEVNPIPVKAALNLMGKEVGPLRLPLTEMEAAHQEVLAEEMQKNSVSNWHKGSRKKQERTQMVKVIMHGCNGHMGQVITQLVEKDPEIEIVAGIDLNDCRDNGYPVFTDIWTCDVQADAVIDFCTAKATDTLLEYCEKMTDPGCIMYYRSDR